MSARIPNAGMRNMMWQQVFRRWLALFSVLVCATNCGMKRNGTSTSLSDSNGTETVLQYVKCEPGEWKSDTGQCVPAGLPPDMPCAPGELELADGRCQPAGLPLDMQCPPGERPLKGGGCQPAGVPPEMCGPGFEPDGNMGCNPILPSEPCPFGLIAVPGETECHEVAPCGNGTWGDVPVDATTQFVNGAYAGNDSDGSKERPWKRIQDAVNSAEDNAIVAIAEGTYHENLNIDLQSIQLWGVCPRKVVVMGSPWGGDVINVSGVAASGTAIHNLAISGGARGTKVTDAENVTLDHVWIHDTNDSGVDVGPINDPTSVSLTSCLV